MHCQWLAVGGLRLRPFRLGYGALRAFELYKTITIRFEQLFYESRGGLHIMRTKLRQTQPVGFRTWFWTLGRVNWVDRRFWWWID